MSFDYNKTSMDHIVKLGAQYLDFCLSAGKTPTLPGILNHIDYFERNVANLEEVNEILNHRPAVFFQRTDKGIVFNSTGGERTLTAEDMEQGIVDYQNDFDRRYKELQARKQAAAGPDSITDKGSTPGPARVP